MCRAFAGSETAQAALGEKIYNTFYQGCLWANDSEAHFVAGSKVCQAGEIHNIQGNILDTRLARSAGITRRHINGSNLF